MTPSWLNLLRPFVRWSCWLDRWPLMLLHAHNWYLSLTHYSFEHQYQGRPYWSCSLPPASTFSQFSRNFPIFPLSARSRDSITTLTLLRCSKWLRHQQHFCEYKNINIYTGTFSISSFHVVCVSWHTEYRLPTSLVAIYRYFMWNKWYENIAGNIRTPSCARCSCALTHHRFGGNRIDEFARVSG